MDFCQTQCHISLTDRMANTFFRQVFAGGSGLISDGWGPVELILEFFGSLGRNT